MAAKLKLEMGGIGFQKMNKEGSIYLIPGGNLDIGELCGTNCFVVGKGKERYLIDACKKDHSQFLDNVIDFLKDQECIFKGILITHAHYDHMDGV